VRHVEISPEGREWVRQAWGADSIDPDTAIVHEEAVVFAVPGSAIGAVAKRLMPTLAAGTRVVILDAAAPYAGHLPERAGIT
jgi:hypothetical protein